MKRRMSRITVLGIITIASLNGCASKLSNSNNKSAVAKPTPHTWEFKQDLAKTGRILNAVAFSPDSSTIGVVGITPEDSLGTLGLTSPSIWDVQNKKVKQVLITDSNSFAVVYSRDGGKLATGGLFKAYVWDTRNKAPEIETPFKTFPNGKSVTSAVALSPDNKTLATGDYENGVIKLWDVETGKEKLELNGHTIGVMGLSFSSDGKTLVSGSKDKTIKLWDVETGREKQTLTGHNGWVYDVNYSPDGTTLVSASEDKTVMIWDVQTGALKQTLTGHGDQVYKAVLSPDGTTIATGSADKTLRLWDAQTGALLQTLNENARDVRGLAFSPDGQLLVTVSYDGTIKVYAPK